jgi:hypothetical protein
MRLAGRGLAMAAVLESIRGATSPPDENGGPDQRSICAADIIELFRMPIALMDSV